MENSFAPAKGQCAGREMKKKRSLHKNGKQRKSKPACGIKKKGAGGEFREALHESRQVRSPGGKVAEKKKRGKSGEGKEEKEGCRKNRPLAQRCLISDGH